MNPAWSSSLTGRLDLRRMRNDVFEMPIAFDRFGQGVLAVGCQVVVLARRSLFTLCDTGLFPFGIDKAGLLEPAQRGVHSPAGQAGYVHDVEAILIAVGQRLQYGRHRV